jgi:hypothetical protein
VPSIGNGEGGKCHCRTGSVVGDRIESPESRRWPLRSDHKATV